MIRGACVLALLSCGHAWAGSSGSLWTWWVQPCTADVAQLSGCEAGDTELARWALEAWSREGQVRFIAVSTEHEARMRIHWVTGSGGLYGETRALDVRGVRGADVYVLPTPGTQTDRLLRDAIVYLTCLHESGHALGLAHTDRFDDIMYSFQFGGDIPEYFGRYRRKLHTREDIARTSALSAHDRASLAAALKEEQ